MSLLLSSISTSPFLVTALATFGIQFFGFVIAFVLKTEVFYDIFGSGNFIILGLWSYYFNTGSARNDYLSTTCTVLFVLSRSWLMLFLGWRAHERKGDSRFDGIRDKFGIFLVYWMLQGCWVYLVSLPMIYINTYIIDESTTLSGLDKILLTFFALAVVIEIASDIQKARWVSKGRWGGFCTIGLWSYSRHPNYFAEMKQWWCCFFLVLSRLQSTTPSLIQGLACSLSPIFTSWILLYAGATGLTNAEGKGLKRYYDSEFAQEYKGYRKNTSILIPMVGYSKLPTWIKRTFLFEWERYEYKDKKEI